MKMQRSTYIGLAVMGALLIGTTALFRGGFPDIAAVMGTKISIIEGSRAEAVEFMSAYRSIELTQAQEKIRQEALAGLPAACCSNFSMATCCCECNLSRSIWGLSKILIAEKGLGAEEVRESAVAWLQALNPTGYAGDACQTGGCGRSLREGGCGGMDENQLIF